MSSSTQTVETRSCRGLSRSCCSGRRPRLLSSNTPQSISPDLHTHTSSHTAGTRVRVRYPGLHIQHLTRPALGLGLDIQVYRHNDKSMSISDGNTVTRWQTGCYQLRQMRLFIRSLTADAAKTFIVQAFIVCRLHGLVQLAVVRCAGKPVWARFSLCRTLQLVYWPTEGAVTTSHRCCVNYIGCQFRDEWSSRLPACASLSHWHQKRRRTSLPTFNSSPSKQGRRSLCSSSKRHSPHRGVSTVWKVGDESRRACGK